MILKFQHYKMTDDLIDFLSNSVINESDKSQSAIDSMLKGLARDLKFNMGLVFTFGVGIRAMYPIVDNLIQNGTLKIEANTENIVLICLAALTITYLEETNNKAGQTEVECSCKSKKDCEICGGTGVVKSIVTKKDAQTILEELKLRGVGNGIIRKMVECFKSIGNISKTLFKNSPYVINGLMDMLAYTGLLLPTMNAISALIGKYDLNMDTLPGNFMAVGLGVTTFLAKNGFDFLLKKLKDKFGLKTSNLDVPTVARPYEIADGDTDTNDIGKNKLIKEQ